MNKKVVIYTLGWGYCSVILVVSALMGEVAAMDMNHSLLLAKLAVLFATSLAFSHLVIKATFFKA